jgi:hypothetical protein
MTLSQMASAIRNHVVDGLNGVSSTAFSIDQLKDEILQTTAFVLVEFTAQGIIDVSKLAQRIDGIRVECKDLSSHCHVDSEIEAPHFMIPNLNRMVDDPITYLGGVDGSVDFKIYFDRDFRFHKYRLATSRSPFAWVSSTPNTVGLYDVFLFNMGKYNSLQFISIDALFDNPYDILKTDYYEQFSSAEFYAPQAVQSKVIDVLTEKYVRRYRQLNTPMKPNTQQA